MVKRYFLRHSHLWNRRDGWRISSCKPRRHQEMFFLITPSNPPAILKQPGHDSANWLCWLDIHHSCRDTAKENARRRRRALKSSGFFFVLFWRSQNLATKQQQGCDEHGGLQLFKPQTHKNMTSCRVYGGHAWTPVMKRFKNIGTVEWQAVQSEDKRAGVDSWVLIGCLAAIWLELSKKKKSASEI